MYWWYEFWVYYCEECSENVTKDHGILSASNYKEAIEKITDYYGDDFITKINIRLCSSLAEDSPYLFETEQDPNRAEYWRDGNN